VPEKTPARWPTELLATLGCSAAHQPGGGVEEGVTEMVGVLEDVTDAEADEVAVRDGVRLRLRERVRDDE